MDVQAILKAGRRLEAAKNQLEAVKASVTFEAFEEAWYFFLVAAKSVQTILKKGSQNDPRSRQWFGLKIKERRKSQLLQYFYQSRDDEEHGLSRATCMMAMQAVPSEAIHTHYRGDLGYVVSEWDGTNATYREFGVLEPVTGRGGDIFHPPTDEELGHPPHEKQAERAASRLLDYLEELLEEAAERAS